MLYRDTSRSAWRSFIPVSAELDRDIMEELRIVYPRGLICQEIEERTGRIHQAVSGNLRHLVERGYVMPSGEYGVTHSNRRAMKWRIAPQKGWKPWEDKPMTRIKEAIEDLWSLADECREWAQGLTLAPIEAKLRHDIQVEFARLADKLDEIAKRLAGKEPPNE